MPVKYAQIFIDCDIASFQIVSASGKRKTEEQGDKCWQYILFIIFLLIRLMQADSCPYRIIGRCIEISVGSGEAVGVVVIETAAPFDVLTAGSVAGVGLWLGSI